jgi:hypothetical protein
LVVLASAVAANDTTERVLPGFGGQPAVGVNTRFAVSAVIKGDKRLKDFVLHHYRLGRGGMKLPNGPNLVSFAIPAKEPQARRTFILFLVREKDDRYAPVVGQTDPGLGIMELGGVYESAVTETRTKLGLDIARALKECQTVRPGMTRAEVLKVFEIEGGLSTVMNRTYVYRDCPYIKVDVEFAPSTSKKEKPTDVVTKISKPYLDWTNSD